MKPGVEIAGVCALDESGIVGSAIEPTTFDPGGLSLQKWRRLFALPNPAYRHQDLFGRCVSLVTEASGISQVLPEERRRGTALVLATGYGCLQSDLDFTRSLEPEQRISPALFPYTLPSTCLGEIAIRHRLQGPLSCLMGGPGQTDAAEEAGLVEARRLIENGEADAAGVCLGDCLLPEHAEAIDVPARLAVACVVLLPAGVMSSPVVGWGQLLSQGGRVERLLEDLRRGANDSEGARD